MVIDNSGQVVWFLPLQGEDEYAMDFKVQYYQGEPVLTWEEGKVVAGYSLGEYVILDGSYQEITRLSASNGYRADHHDFLITSDATAMFTIYSPVSMDLFSIGGPKNGVVADGIVQAVDMGTGEMFFEWHSLDHVALDESYYEPSKDQRETVDYCCCVREAFSIWGSYAAFCGESAGVSAEKLAAVVLTPLVGQIEDLEVRAERLGVEAEAGLVEQVRESLAETWHIVEARGA